MFARVGASFAPFTFFFNLAWAGVLWIAVMRIWGLYLFRRIRLNPD
jgi:hypothetical protein